MTKYRVEIDGTTVWSGEGDTYKVIPAEYRDRPADTAEGEPHPSPHYLYESLEDENGVHGEADQLIGVQIAHTDELEQIIAYAGRIPDEIFTLIADAAAHPDDAAAVQAAAGFHPEDVAAVKASVVASGQLRNIRSGLGAHAVPNAAVDAPVSFVKRAPAQPEGN